MTLRHPITGRVVIVTKRGVYEAYRSAGYMPADNGAKR